MKWLLSLLFLTSVCIASGFFIAQNYVFAYRWMTTGMAIVSFIFYFMINKNSAKNANGNLAAIVLKFILSSLVVIIYIAMTKSKNKIDYFFFLGAYVIFSSVSYAGAYYSIKKEKTKV
jgi:hypothetical protein